ncbi:hypothetical protein CHLNCDRAFT_144542 [Chlorella variabilis]|uniref:Presenilin n=1 Tax=Chlorella variabilis TaxID=554065 RepID=E1ZBN0_CHLVA|nr:hypothetical protein CHLNCDRAFT_144542 [Chlorella variabilis]EFN56673.1 hypothetical protein CHLNCDRAFT_144542 [Chlorella variabilis]|eukprot:XP_005848775.1 hypothetical protein CHLNCDRAFT_144542 [Chlorella variabilis]
MARSVLDDLGEEVTGIVAPVSICMAITLALVRILNPEGDSDSNSVFLASAYYVEQEGDSPGQKLSGAVVNALIFVGVVAAMTFALVLLFKHGYVRVIYAYMGFAGFSIFFVLTGLISIQLLQKAAIHTDFITFTYILLNFAAVGSLTLFFFPAPLLMKQCYLIVTGVVTAYVFTWIPPWTTWTLLVAMAVYDVVAVLVPGGPLKMLVELAQEREEALPALVYEARPVRRQPSQPRSQEGEGEGRPEGGSAAGLGDTELPPRPAPPPQQPQPAPQPLLQPGENAVPSGSGRGIIHPGGRLRAAAGEVEVEVEAEADTQALLGPPAQRGVGVPGQSGGYGYAADEDDEDEDAFALPDSIKLGLGDFIFYSICLSRAAFSGWAAAFATYLAILAGLGCTLLWLAVARRALPALPISIALAVACFVLAKAVMEAVVLPASLALVYF